MIQTDAELVAVQEQLSLAEKGLALLRRTKSAHHPQQYELFAEPYIEMIRRLRSEIDTYLGFPNAGIAPAPVAGSPVPSHSD